MEEAKFSCLTVGASASMSKTISEGDIYNYAGIAGDFNPAHINEQYAKQSMFGQRIAHGMLSAGLISAVIGNKLPGPGTIYLEQSLRFSKPVRIGDTVTATVTVKELLAEKHRAVLSTTCVNQDGMLVISGEAKVLVPGE